jgi:hypothetical protein
LSKSRFDIPDPNYLLKKIKNQKGEDKYKFGDTSHKISDFKHHKPVFAFDYISLNRTTYCFNSTLIDAKKDYLKLIEGLKKLSAKTYDEISKDQSLHFHEVDFDSTSTSIPVSVFVKCLTASSNPNHDQCPTVYQFEIFGASRVFGFIHNFVFYPVLLDKNHTIYKRK